MQCLECEYSLISLETNRCPECGRGFDPQKPWTFHDPKASGLFRRRCADCVYGEDWVPIRRCGRCMRRAWILFSLPIVWFFLGVALSIVIGESPMDPPGIQCAGKDYLDWPTCFVLGFMEAALIVFGLVGVMVVWVAGRWVVRRVLWR
ncbi:MAG TPA: hypothetical protein VG711_04185 [Phycisphaerales bacterium]|nr:hypothetical protein [Phycisphaerales bacterium]